MIWNRFYCTKSFLDKGSMCQLRNLIDRRNVSANSESDYNACDDFLVLVIECHIIASAMEYLKMEATTSQPSHHMMTEELWMEDDVHRRDVLLSISKEIVMEYVDLSTEPVKNTESIDKVQTYACELLSYGLFYLEFSDSIREGDGTRILRCWRYLMLIFKLGKRRNYSIEGLNLLSQFSFFFTERQRQQLIWSRCVNIHGIPGRNIPADLHMEHLNKVCKMAVNDLGANKTPAALKRASKCLGILVNVLATFDKEFGVSDKSGSHSCPKTQKDMDIILQELIQSGVFRTVPNRSYTCLSLYNKLKRNPLSTINGKELHKWMFKHLTSLRNILY